MGPSRGRLQQAHRDTDVALSPARPPLLAALRLPGFRWIASVYAIHYLVELASSVALMVLVYDATDSALAAAAMLVCKQVIPGLLSASLGHELDRVSVRTGLTLSYAALTAAFALLVATGYSLLLFGLAIVAGMAGATVRALLRTGVARSTNGTDRRHANAVLNVLMGVFALVGPAVGAVLVTALSATAALAISAVGAGLLGLAAVAMPRALGVAASRDEPGAPETPDTSSPVAKSRVTAGGLLFIGGFLIALFAMDEPSLLAYSERSLDAGVGGYGAVLTAWGLGMIGGSILYARILGQSLPRLFVLASAVQALAYVGLGLAPSLLWALLFATVGGAGNGVMWVALVTAIQERVPSELQAATAARLEGVVTAAPAVGMLLGGLIAETFSPRATLVLPGCLSLIALAIWSTANRPTRRTPTARTQPLERPLDAAA